MPQREPTLRHVRAAYVDIDQLGMLEAARAGRLRVLYAVGADPATDYPDAGAWTEARRRLGALVVHELFMTRTAASADVVLPALSFAEKAGTVCNIEGRIQRQDQAVLGPGTARADALIFSQVAAQLGAVLGFSSWQDVFAGIGRIIPGWQENGRLPPPRRAPGRAQQPPRSAGSGPDSGASFADGSPSSSRTRRRSHRTTTSRGSS